MKGITDSAILLVVGVIVLVIVVGAFLVAITQPSQSSGGGGGSFGSCSDNSDCASSPDGPWCAQIYSGEGLSDTRCVCYRNADCEGGYECVDSKCGRVE